jgi:hypothetical protein
MNSKRKVEQCEQSTGSSQTEALRVLSTRVSFPPCHLMNQQFARFCNPRVAATIGPVPCRPVGPARDRLWHDSRR